MSAATVATTKNDNTRTRAFEIPAAALARWMHARQQAEIVRDHDMPAHRGTRRWPWIRRPATEAAMRTAAMILTTALVLAGCGAPPPAAEPKPDRAWVLWLQGAWKDADGERQSSAWDPIDGFDTARECSDGKREHLKGGGVGVFADIGTMIFSYLCLPDTVNPNRRGR